MSQRRTNRNPDTNNVQMKKNLHQHKAFNSPEHVNCSPNQCPTQNPTPAIACAIVRAPATYLVSEQHRAKHSNLSIKSHPPSELSSLQKKNCLLCRQELQFHRHEAAASLRRMLSSVWSKLFNKSSSDAFDSSVDASSFKANLRAPSQVYLAHENQIVRRKPLLNQCARRGVFMRRGKSNNTIQDSPRASHL